MMNENEKTRLEALEKEVQELRQWKTNVETLFKQFLSLSSEKSFTETVVEEKICIDEEEMKKDMEYYKVVVSRLKRLYDLYAEATSKAFYQKISPRAFSEIFMGKFGYDLYNDYKYKCLLFPSDIDFEEKFINEYLFRYMYRCKKMRKLFDYVYYASEEELTNSFWYEKVRNVLEEKCKNYKNYNRFMDIMKETFIG